MKLFAIPLELIDCLNHLSSGDRGTTYTLIFNYIYHGKTPDKDISPSARAAFEMAILILKDDLLQYQSACVSEALKEGRKPEEPEKDVPEKPTYTNTPVNPHRPLIHDNSLIHTLKYLKEVPKQPTMERVVKEVFLSCKDPVLADRIIRGEFKRRHPGYAGLIYDRQGHVTFIPRDVS